MKRTAVIYIFTVLAVVAGVIAALDTLRYLWAFFTPLRFFFSPFLGAVLSGLVAIIWFWVAARIWNVDPQGWLFMVSIATIYLIFDVLALIAGTPFELLLGSIAINILVLILGLLPSTKSEFGTG
jgi:hypothetical protein